MRRSLWTRPTGHGTASWPVLAWLVVVVLVPTIAVLWFMSQAMHNEQLAVRQKLREVYRAQLIRRQLELQEMWQHRMAKLDPDDADLAPARRFADRLGTGLVDSVVIVDGNGRPAYPAPPTASTPTPRPIGWLRAEQLENSGQPLAAADRYASLAAASDEPETMARALIAQARCLDRAGQRQAALQVLVHDLGRPELQNATDHQGRWITPSAQLRAIELLAQGDETDAERQRILVQALHQRLTTYDDTGLPAGQRRFLMQRLAELAPEAPPFETLGAEWLAQRYLDANPATPATTSWLPSGLDGVWHIALPTSGAVALVDQHRLLDDLGDWLGEQQPVEGGSIELLAPGTEIDEPFAVTVATGEMLPGWSLVWRPDDLSLFTAAADQRIAAYRITAGLVVAAVLALALVVARTVHRQLHLTWLKNDLLSTVSHELKTPLASMRLLVDTLIDSGLDDQQRTRDYLRLIGQENTRLSRLVDNFLSFSKLERGQPDIERRALPVAEVVASAVAAFGDRVSQAGGHFEVEVEPDLPPVLGDHDALVTIVLNLLDNAEKYSPDNKDVTLRATRDRDMIALSVQDRGIGLSRREADKIFDRFYQVDQRLSRVGGGCGLGLSIVQRLVEAHNGTIDVTSRPGAGSTFTVHLPTAPQDRPQRANEESDHG